MRILVIEDEEKLAQSIKKGLETNGYAVDYILDGAEGEERIILYYKDYDLVILDLMLPNRSGLEICEEMRRRGITTPVLILTAREAVEDKIAALDKGSDDYLVKPFSFDELLARIRSLLRRPTSILPSHITVRDLSLDPAKREVYRTGKKINLTLKEFELLQYFMRHADLVLNREDIYTHLWDFADNSFSNTIDVHVKNLRHKLGYENDKEFIETVRGVGYRLKK